MRRFVGSAMLAIAAYWIARAAGVPVWMDWTPGDCADVALLVGTGAWLLSYRGGAHS